MTLSVKSKACVAAAAIFLGSLIAAYLVHITFFKIDVVLYSALGDVLVATVGLAAALFALRFFQLFTRLEKTLLTTSACLAGCLLALLLPTVIDRSLSIYLLEKLQQRGGGIRLDRFEEVVAREYLKEHQLVNIRLTEQLESGTITIANGCVQLTDRGRTLATFSRAFRKHLLPRQRLIMGGYSDALTDPFRESPATTDYGCN